MIVARAGLHEFAFGFSSENPWFGPVRNPHDPATSPGGSSGGSGAVVASGAAPISIGTDTGGSIRVPAALCGIFGLKVTHGRVPLTGVFPLGASLDTVGPLAANTGDLAVGYASLAGWHPEDPWSAPRPTDLDLLNAPLEPRDLRVGLPEQWIANAPYGAGYRERFDVIIGQLESLGVGVEQFDDPVLLPPGRLENFFYPQVAAVHRRWWEEGRPYGREVAGRIRETLEIGGDHPTEALLDAKRWQAHLQHRMSAAFQRFHLLALPTAGALRKVIGDQEIAYGHSRQACLPGGAVLVQLPGQRVRLSGDQHPRSSAGPDLRRPLFAAIGGSMVERGPVAPSIGDPGEGRCGPLGPGSRDLAVPSVPVRLRFPVRFAIRGLKSRGSKYYWLPDTEV